MKDADVAVAAIVRKHHDLHAFMIHWIKRDRRIKERGCAGKRCIIRGNLLKDESRGENGRDGCWIRAQKERAPALIEKDPLWIRL